VRVFESIAEWQEYRSRFAPELELGFVPTMGALHAGHVSLTQRSRLKNKKTAVSIFVNPTQFNDPKDLAGYPRTMERDQEILKESGVDYLIAPRSYDELYPDGYTYRVSETKHSLVLEGSTRPGHFEGMMTVVLKLLCAVRPARAYFGEKDFQQLSLIQGMACAFFLNTEIIGCPTIREESGLAMSSRNTRLNQAERENARKFPEILARFELTARQAADELRQQGFQVEYVEDWNGRRLGAVRLGSVRLIDNFEIPSLKSASLKGGVHDTCT
jgi:pantoate--beta-alanine ligase